MGRPRIAKKKQRMACTFYVLPEELEAMRLRAVLVDRPLSQWVREQLLSLLAMP